MPCSSDNQGAYYDQQEINKLTRVACDLAKTLRAGGSEKQLALETRQWIAEHDELDRRREREENARALREQHRMSAIGKLTPEERKALGIMTSEVAHREEEATDNLNPKAFADLYRIAKLLSKRNNGVVIVPSPAGIMPMDLETVLKDLDSAVRLAETCPYCER